MKQFLEVVECWLSVLISKAGYFSRNTLRGTLQCLHDMDTVCFITCTCSNSWAIRRDRQLDLHHLSIFDSPLYTWANRLLSKLTIISSSSAVSLGFIQTGAPIMGWHESIVPVRFGTQSLRNSQKGLKGVPPKIKICSHLVGGIHLLDLAPCCASFETCRYLREWV